MVRQWDLCKRQPGYVLGFHGCDKSVGEAVLADGGGHLKHGTNDYDWLGSGIYFWEGSPERAFQFAEAAAGTNKKTTKGGIKAPYVLGAIIDLGNCFNLGDASALKELHAAYEHFADIMSAADLDLPKNRGGSDLLLRNLDRAVLETMQFLRTDAHSKTGISPPYDTVRSPFGEGGVNRNKNGCRE